MLCHTRSCYVLLRCLALCCRITSCHLPVLAKQAPALKPCVNNIKPTPPPNISAEGNEFGNGMSYPVCTRLPRALTRLNLLSFRKVEDEGITALCLALPATLQEPKLKRELRGPQGLGVVSNSWFDRVCLSMLYMFEPSCRPMFQLPSLGGP